jgi:regulator of RNase E activity RraA
MSITIKELPELPGTYFIDEAKAIPTSHLGIIQSGIGYLGPHFQRQTGAGIMAGWALTVECPADNNMASYVALQYIRDMATSGRWVLVIAPPSDAKISEVSMWNYLQSAMGWEVGFVGAVVAGYMRDMDEINEKLKGEFSVFSYGGNPVPAVRAPEGRIGFPININGVTINTGDMIVGDNDGVLVVPMGMVEDSIDKCRQNIVHEVNILQHVREGMGAVDVLELRNELQGKVNLVE